MTPEKTEGQGAPASSGGRGEEEEEGLGEAREGSSGGQEQQGEVEGEGGGSGKGGEEEEESDLKLAWEVLELARVICQRYVKHSCILTYISLFHTALTLSLSLNFSPLHLSH